MGAQRSYLPRALRIGSSWRGTRAHGNWRHDEHLRASPAGASPRGSRRHRRAVRSLRRAALAAVLAAEAATPRPEVAAHPARSEGLEPATFRSVVTGKRSLTSCFSRSLVPIRPPASTCMYQGCCTRLLCPPSSLLGSSAPVQRKGPRRCLSCPRGGSSASTREAVSSRCLTAMARRAHAPHQRSQSPVGSAHVRRTRPPGRCGGGAGPGGRRDRGAPVQRAGIAGEAEPDIRRHRPAGACGAAPPR